MAAKYLKQEIQPDFDHIMGLFDQMKEQFRRDIDQRNPSNNDVIGGFSNPSAGGENSKGNKRESFIAKKDQLGSGSSSNILITPQKS